MTLQIFILLASVAAVCQLLRPIDAFSSSTASTLNLFSSHVSSTSSSSSSSISNNNNGVTLTFLEINGWLMSTGGCTILIDPLLEGPLDFGIPNLYQGTKRVLPQSGLTEKLPPIDCVLLTQGLDDHANIRTLTTLHKLDPTVSIVAPPSAKGALKAAGFYSETNQHVLGSQHQPSGRIRFLKHREETTIQSRNDESSSVRIRATEGALVGPPWQRRENGYIINGRKFSKSPSIPTRRELSSPSPLSIYIEPHVEFNKKELELLGPVDVVISPISGQGLPAFELVHGPKDTIRLLEILQPKFLVPMKNGEVEAKGPVSKLVSEVGSVREFQELFFRSSVGPTTSLKTQLVDVYPGKDIQLST